MRKISWVWILVAFLVGLAPGAAGAWWLRSSAVSARQELMRRNSDLHAENQTLLTRLNSAEATISVLGGKLQNAATAATAPSSGGASTTGTETGGTPSGPPSITERAVSPQEVSAEGQLTLTVKLTGHASRVNMRIASKSGAFDKTYFLARKSFNGGGEVWEATVEAPSGKGEYRFYAIAYDANNIKYPMPGVSGFTFLVR